MTTVAPAVEGTHLLIEPGTLGPDSASYTTGRRAVCEAAERLTAGIITRLAVDIETEGLGALAMNVKAVVIATTTEAVVFDPRDEVQARAVRDTLSSAGSLIFHNSAFDVPILVRKGLMAERDIAKVWDTLIFARMAEPDERTAKNLAAAAKRYLEAEIHGDMMTAFKAAGMTKAEGYAEFDLDRFRYIWGAAVDGIATARLADPVWHAVLARLTTGHPFDDFASVSGTEARQLVLREQIINRMFLRRAAKGLRVDFDFLNDYADQVTRQQTADRAALEGIGIEPSKPASLVGYLEAHNLLPSDHPRTPKTGKPSTRKAHLEALVNLEDPVVRIYVRHKEVTKILEDYLRKTVSLADGDGRIHPTTSVLAAATGRASMSDPPLHQFPGEARGIVLADEGDEMVSIDWSQIEPVVAANAAHDFEVLRGYEDGSSDLYSTIAEFADIDRSTAKVVLLAQMYGQGVRSLAASLGTTMDEAYAVRGLVLDSMPATARMISALRDIGEQHQLIFTISGRILPIPSGTWGVSVHKAVNYFVQGSAYDVLADTLVRVEEAGLGDALYVTMHDELVVSADAADDIEMIMRTPPDRLCEIAGRIPVLRTDRAELGERWAAA